MNIKTLLNGIARVMFPAVAVAVICATHALGAIDGFVTRLNIVFPDGSIMFYTGANAGLVAGEEYVMISNGQRVATVRLSRVDQYASNAIITSSDAPLQEGAVYTFKYMAGTFVPGEVMAPLKVKRIDGAEAPVPTTASKKKTSESTDTKASSSSRRRSATSSDDNKEDLKEKEDTSSRRSTSSSSSSSSSSRDRKTTEKPKETAKPKAQPAATTKKYLSSGISRENLTGLILIPSADTLEENHARVSLGHSFRLNSWEAYSDTVLGTTYTGQYHMDKKTTSLYLTYGVTEKFEVSVASRKIQQDYYDRFDQDILTDFNTTADVVCGGGYTGSKTECLYPRSGKSTEISMKYHFLESEEKDHTPVDLSAMLSWEKIRHRDQRFGNSTYVESNDWTKNFTYGLVGSVTLSEVTGAHIFWARERAREHTASSSASGTSSTNKILGLGISYKASDLVDLYLEYLRKDENFSWSSEDLDTTEKSLGIRYRLNDDILLDGAYIFDYEEELGDGLEFNDKYWMLGAQYLL